MTPQSVSAYVKVAENLRGEVSVEEWARVREIVEESATTQLEEADPTLQ